MMLSGQTGQIAAPGSSSHFEKGHCSNLQYVLASAHVAEEKSFLRDYSLDFQGNK
jgi:secreted trypsin-like serine protease